MMLVTTPNENWKPGMNSSFVSHASNAIPAAARLLSVNGFRSANCPASTTAAMTDARTLPGLSPVISA